MSKAKKSKSDTKPNLKDVIVSFAAPREVADHLQREADDRGLSRSSLCLWLVWLFTAIDREVLQAVCAMAERLMIPARHLIGAALSSYVAMKLGQLAVIGPDNLRHLELSVDGNGPITGKRRLDLLAKDFERRERLMWFGVFSLKAPEELTDEQIKFMDEIRSNEQLLKEVESVMAFNPQQDAA